MKTKKQAGEVKVTQALNTIQNIFNEAAPNGSMHCQMETNRKESIFAFVANGICMTLHVQAFEPAKGGAR